MSAYHESVVGIPWQNIKTIYIDFPWGYEAHWHLEYEIIYVKQGRQRITLEKEMIELNQGDFLIVAPGQVHSYSDEEGKSEVMIIVLEQIIFHNLGLASHEKDIILGLLSKTQIARFTYSEELKNTFDTLCLKMDKESQEKMTGYIVCLHAYVYQFLMHAFRNISFTLVEKQETGAYKMKFNKLSPVFDFVEQNYSLTITLEDVTKEVHFNKFYFCKLFKEVTDTTFVNYLNNFRVSKAERELLNTRKTIAQISMEVGFESVDSFTRAFKSMNKCTPSSYRKKYVS